jgi:hypothetical protein
MSIAKFHSLEETNSRIAFCKVCPARDSVTASCTEQGDDGATKYPLENVVSVNRCECPRGNWTPIDISARLEFEPDGTLAAVADFKSEVMGG